MGLVVGFMESKSKDEYGLTYNLSKKKIPVALPMLAYLIKVCLYESIYHDNLKVSRTFPILKKGSHSDIKILEPKSVTTFLAKVFKALIFCQDYDYLRYISFSCLTILDFIGRSLSAVETLVKAIYDLF